MLRRKYPQTVTGESRTEDPRRTASCFQAHTSQPLTSLPSAHPSDLPPEPRSPPLSLLIIHLPTTIIPTSPIPRVFSSPRRQRYSVSSFVPSLDTPLAFTLPFRPVYSNSQTSRIQLPTDAPINSETPPLRTLDIPFFTS